MVVLEQMGDDVVLPDRFSAGIHGAGDMDVLHGGPGLAPPQGLRGSGSHYHLRLQPQSVLQRTLPRPFVLAVVEVGQLEGATGEQLIPFNHQGTAHTQTTEAAYAGRQNREESVPSDVVAHVRPSHLRLVIHPPAWLAGHGRGLLLRK